MYSPISLNITVNFNAIYCFMCPRVIVGDRENKIRFTQLKVSFVNRDKYF